MSTRFINKFFISAGLLAVLIFTVSSVANAQSETSLAHTDVPTKDGIHDPHPTPEPITVLLFGTGLFGVAALARRRLQKNDNSDDKS